MEIAALCTMRSEITRVAQAANECDSQLGPASFAVGSRTHPLRRRTRPQLNSDTLRGFYTQGELVSCRNQQSYSPATAVKLSWQGGAVPSAIAGSPPLQRRHARRHCRQTGKQFLPGWYDLVRRQKESEMPTVSEFNRIGVLHTDLVVGPIN